MRIEMNKIKIREVTDGFKDSAEEGVVGYGGKLNIRPSFQREFVYKEKQRNAVIETVTRGFPLNVMYWSETENGSFELLDGQQRTLSICQYVNGDFSVDSRAFHNLTKEEQEQILDYELTIYICNGTIKEKLDWFEIINIAGVELKPQELKNAIYTGEWLTSAKRFFSKNGCAAYNLASKYITGEVNRQDYLETALRWICAREGKTIRDYMAEHQHDTHATPLWQYFRQVINWVTDVFTVYRREMKGLEWGFMYNEYGGNSYDPQVMEQKTAALMQDDDITKRPGIYEYLLSGNEKFLNIRAFTENERRRAYERQGGICPYCVAERRARIHYEIDEMEADHITPWRDGGKTNAENCQMLCKEHNRRKAAN